MAGALIQTETALDECRVHLEHTNAFGTAIEAYLTRHLLVLLCSEVESHVRELIHDKADHESTEAISSLVRQIGRNLVRNAKHSEIKEVLGYLGKPYAERYDELVRSAISEADMARLGNAVESRNKVAHRAPPLVTFNEVVSAHQAAEKVVEAARTAVDQD